MLSDREILEALDHGEIVISPFQREQLGNSSYDVRLGEYAYTESKEKRMFNIWSEEGTKETWEPLESISKEELCRLYPMDDFQKIKEGSRIFVLEPGQNILAHTEEYIGGVRGITTKMYCRSSYGRCNICVCQCAGLGDAGYYNRWTMEIKNQNKYHSVPLVVGEPIAQICFFRFGKEEMQNYTEKGHYQQERDLERLKKEWRMEQMLPKLYL